MAADVAVDDVEAHLHEDGGRLGQLVGVGAHDLARERVVLEAARAVDGQGRVLGDGLGGARRVGGEAAGEVVGGLAVTAAA